MKYYRILMINLFLSIILGACASETQVMVGKVSQEQLMKDEHFVLSSAENILSVEKIQQIKRWPAGLHIDIYFGAWCHDSQREVPKMLHILNENKDISTQLIALDYNKSDPQGLAASMGIKYTPTFIVSLGNKELGRIIERPIQDLVTDITEMVAGY
ncbi:MAG: thioredoxin 1 [Alteromonadaceae bacterium]|jgi:thioredoxin 1